MRILIVEDDVMSREMMYSMLEAYGDCDLAANGGEGLDAFKSALEKGQSYDMICLDLIMPDMTGHEVLKTIRSLEEERNILPPDCSKVIIVSAMADSENIMGAFINQCESYLIKPVKNSDILEQMRLFGFIV